jgi:voltage-gated potassium channel
VTRLSISTLPYKRVVAGIAALVLVLAVGTAGYMVIEGWSFLDAVYMASITITTVGYREVEPLSDAGVVFTMGLLFVGVGTAFYILTALVAAIIEGDFGQVFGLRRMRDTIKHLKGHLVVCGYGRVGAEVAAELRERDTRFVVIDSNEDALENARTAGALTVKGDATVEEVLIEAGIQSCSAVIAASDSDVTNTYITLTVRSLRPDVFIVARVSSPLVERKLRQAGADRIVSPYAMGGRRMAYAALQPLVSDFIDLLPANAHKDRIMADILIDETSRLSGLTLAEVLEGCLDVVVLAVRDASGHMEVGPAPSRKVELGDRLTVVGNEDTLRSVGSRKLATRS